MNCHRNSIVVVHLTFERIIEPELIRSPTVRLQNNFYVNNKQKKR